MRAANITSGLQQTRNSRLAMTTKEKNRFHPLKQPHQAAHVLLAVFSWAAIFFNNAEPSLCIWDYRIVDFGDQIPDEQALIDCNVSVQIPPSSVLQRYILCMYLSGCRQLLFHDSFRKLEEAQETSWRQNPGLAKERIQVKGGKFTHSAGFFLHKSVRGKENITLYVLTLQALRDAAKTGEDWGSFRLLQARAQLYFLLKSRPARVVCTRIPIYNETFV